MEQKPIAHKSVARSCILFHVIWKQNCLKRARKAKDRETGDRRQGTGRNEKRTKITIWVHVHFILARQVNTIYIHIWMRVLEYICACTLWAKPSQMTQLKENSCVSIMTMIVQQQRQGKNMGNKDTGRRSNGLDGERERERGCGWP